MLPPESSEAPAAPPTLAGHHKRPSLSNPMHWLTRTTSSASKGSLRHAEHKPIRSIEILSPQRRGVLGAGATVVRTPDEALRDSTVRLTHNDHRTEDVSLPKPGTESPQPQNQLQRLPSPDTLRGRLQDRQHALRQQQQRLAAPPEIAEQSEEARPMSDHHDFEPPTRVSAQTQSELDQASVHSELPSPPYSPPLPPLPISEPTSFFSEDSASSSQMPRPSPRAVPPERDIPPVPSLASRLKTAIQPISVAQSTSSYSSEDHPLPSSSILSSVALACVPPLVPPSPFRAILLSEIPTSAIDPSKIIITLETSTSSYRTTLDTLRSRPSNIASYLTELLARSATENYNDRSSVYSGQSDDVSTYQHHLTGLGLLPQSSFSMHLFLDRPSEPYTHILHYLRSPVGTPEHPESLPHSVRLPTTIHYPSQFSSNSSRVDALHELREEAHFLNLPHLVELCTEELIRYARLESRPHAPLVVRSATPQTRQAHLHEKSSSSSGSASGQNSRSGSIHSMQASVHSLSEALAADVATEGTEGSNPIRKSATARSEARPLPPTQGHLSESKITSKGETTAPHGVRSPPTPQSWLSGQRSRSQSSSGSLRRLPPTPPAGWI